MIDVPGTNAAPPAPRRHRPVMTCAIAVILLMTVDSRAAQDPGAAHQNWAGTWRGTLTNLPPRAGSAPVDVTMEIGPFPAADNTCATWRTTYAEAGQARGVKDYRLCRGTGPDDLFIDEGDGVKLTARWIGDVLVSPFKYDNLLLVTEMRLRGDVLEEEILVVDDQPAAKGVVPLRPRSLQRIVLRRLPQASR
jgi:hypothetical protein